jgi:predicted amidophosphoribosyltransferase
MCPVCRARFRGASRCSRCGADLTVVMTLAVTAWRLRRAARQALAAGEFAKARRLGAEAQELYSTPAGKSLEIVAACLSG